jgi:hypothetical protein
LIAGIYYVLDVFRDINRDPVYGRGLSPASISWKREAAEQSKTKHKYFARSCESSEIWN